MTTSFNDIFQSKLDTIETIRKVEIEHLRNNLKKLSLRKTILAIVFFIIWLILCWPISIIAGFFVNAITLLIFVLLYHKLTPLIEKNWQSEDVSLATIRGRYAQLSLAGSLDGNHRKLSGWGSEALGAKFEVHVGMQYENKGYKVEYRGLLLRQYDNGIDLVCTLRKERFFVQCKYWQQKRPVGHDVVYRLKTSMNKEMGLPINKDFTIKGIIVASSNLTGKAKKMALDNNIAFIEGVKLPS